MKQAVAIDFERLFNLAKETGEVEALENNLFQLYQLQRKNFEVRQLLNAKIVSDTDRLTTLKDLPGFVPSPVFEQLLLLLFSNDMTDKIYYVQDGFGKVLDQKLNRITVQVSSAVPISESFSDEIRRDLEKALKKTVVIRTSVDEKLVAGVILNLPNGKIYDFSYRRMLSQLKYYLMEKN